jgi:pSer/pThr/pTyr-binding forkhead associated (FHA) protein
MKLKLVVLAGAKEGLEIPLKKEKFLIGRAKECALRAGSEAISRQHCAISRHESGYTVKDLGSRNGTYVNDKRITEEVPLAAGNELRVGPLKFRVDTIAEKVEKAATPGANSPLPANPAVPVANGTPRKHPPVKDVAGVVERTISLSDSMTEDDVSRWLLGITDKDGPETLKETRSLRAEDTRTNLTKATMTGNTATVEDVAQQLAAAAAEAEDEAAEATAGEPGAEESKDEEGSGVWKWMKRGKAGPGKKQAPGKLPPRTDQGPKKDSRDAAADILREMQRRR